MSQKKEKGDEDEGNEVVALSCQSKTKATVDGSEEASSQFCDSSSTEQRVVAKFRPGCTHAQPASRKDVCCARGPRRYNEYTFRSCIESRSQALDLRVYPTLGPRSPKEKLFYWTPKPVARRNTAAAYGHYRDAVTRFRLVLD